MARTTARREALANAATDYVLEHGLIGLSLRPLAAALGTSDRMLLYHFADKEDLESTVVRVSTDRSVAEVRALQRAPDVRSAVLHLWTAMTAGQLERCQRLYVEAAALGLFGREPQAATVRDSNHRWTEAVADYLVDAGAPREQARRAAVLVDATFAGLQLDLPLDPDSPTQRRTVQDLADAVATITR